MGPYFCKNKISILNQLSCDLVVVVVVVSDNKSFNIVNIKATKMKRLQDKEEVVGGDTNLSEEEKEPEVTKRLKQTD